MMFSFNILYAEPFSISRVQKTAGVPLSEMNYDLPYKDVITDYDYSQLNDKAKVKKANEFLLKLNRKAKYLRNADTDSMNKGYAYFLAFHKYIMESLESIKDEKVKNSPEYHLAYTLGYLAKNGLYEYESILTHIKNLKDMSLAQMKKYIEHKEDDTELVEKIYKLITVLNSILKIQIEPNKLLKVIVFTSSLGTFAILEAASLYKADLAAKLGFNNSFVTCIADITLVSIFKVHKIVFEESNEKYLMSPILVIGVPVLISYNSI